MLAATLLSLAFFFLLLDPVLACDYHGCNESDLVENDQRERENQLSTTAEIANKPTVKYGRIWRNFLTVTIPIPTRRAPCEANVPMRVPCRRPSGICRASTRASGDRIILSDGLAVPDSNQLRN